ncbi:MAG: competence protein ComFB [Bacillaceae bacterium]|jgi:competence protein ComFB|uniref:Competence protein ComF n=3 Tax=Aeribacillus TaxID=1055323 RepID=A0A165Z9P2_9BACI|nr:MULTISPECIES: competence protein ComFB [Aeribacillus]REJ20907.1 MAG: competence protein ComFB [Bacillaceae bacterium]ASS90121.1 competence protein ComFB [Aeribacillus pallidus]KZM57599.1 competence protein ComF [Aeribacillus pallidus]KZN98019.1 competence protein ComF [Aeribacillus pallidus]MDR9797982.1 competence protein ComFB [Aeribacillus pallidus]
MIVNALEKIMEELLDEYIDQFHMECTCPTCRNDVLALVLNRVQPRYVTSEDKITYVRAEFFDRQQMTSLLVSLAECARIVSENPRCDNRKA